MIYLVSNTVALIPNEVYSISTIDKCLEYFKEHKIIQLDTETTGFDPHTSRLLTVQLGDRYNQWVLEMASIDIQRLKPLLEDKDRTFILQNAKFDLRFFYKHNIFIQNVYDTFLVECILNTGVEDAALGLDDLADKYCGAVLDKTSDYFQMRSIQSTASVTGANLYNNTNFAVSTALSNPTAGDSDVKITVLYSVINL